MRTLFRFVSLSIAMAVSIGCADPYAGRMEVSGEVKLAGQPLKDGSIAFIPLDGQETQSGAAVTAGAYLVPRTSGLKPGNYLVQISAGDGKTPANEEAAEPGGSTNIVSLDLIPEEWNTKSQQKVEIKASSPNRFSFDIPKLNPKKKR